MGKQVKKHGYSCKLVRVVDGDTCDAMIDLGFDVWVKSRIRFYGVDTWESRTRDLEEKVFQMILGLYMLIVRLLQPLTIEKSIDLSLLIFLNVHLYQQIFESTTLM